MKDRTTELDLDKWILNEIISLITDISENWQINLKIGNPSINFE